ncbi:spinster family MFS transporter [Herminiimonas arsenitoxidans]|uniref:spinster family MFS transporter n=1 Tax=Herminiimonas arsenitoxidans TaxID=1809410 RepID=UPI0009703777|nr:MFS transporter [Herminiimonas arsenitoxidans]
MELNTVLTDDIELTTVAEAEIEEAAEDKVPARSWYALAILALIYACDFLDRTMISIIVEPVRIEFGLSDSQLGLLTGLAYGVSFALAAIPIGFLIDRNNRVRLLAGLVAIWGAMTALSYFAQNFVQLLLARMGVGAAEAGGTPASFSLISDFFPPSKRSTAVGYLFIGNAIGAALTIVIGGYVTAHYGWRLAMLIAGVPGLILATLLVLTVREPKRGGYDAAVLVAKEAVAPLTVILYIVKNRAVLHLIAGTSITTAAIATLGVWMPAFVMRFHGLNIEKAGMVAALAGGLFTAIGSVIGGIACDHIGKSNPRRRIDVCVVICFITLLISCGAILFKPTLLAIVLLCLAMFFAFVVFPASFGTMLTLVSPDMRGVTSATMMICTNLVGYGLGPFMVGVLSDLYGGDQSLRFAMMTIMCICCPWAGLHFALSARAYRSAA